MLYANNNFLKKSKPRYYSTHVWRLMYLINTNNVYHNLMKKIYNRSTTIPSIFINCEIFVYSGLKWLSRILSKWVIGYKFGSLSWNRKRAVYKSKQLKKK